MHAMSKITHAHVGLWRHISFPSGISGTLQHFLNITGGYYS